MWSAAGFAMYHAHDGYLDVLLQVGVVGCVIGAGFLLVALAAGVRGAVVERAPAARWAFATVVSLVVLNVTESYFGAALGWLALQFAYFAALRSAPAPSARSLPRPGAAASTATSTPTERMPVL
jgi:O-antigen ligase